MPGQDGEKKKKKGFLSFLSKKKAGSFKLVRTEGSHGYGCPIERLYFLISICDTSDPLCYRRGGGRNLDSDLDGANQK